jgi:DNA-binding MarR family transcriptional regulator
MEGVGAQDATRAGVPSGAARGPRWLAPEQLDTWLAFSAVMVTLPYELDAQLQRESGINQFEYHVLAMLSEAAGRSRRMSEVAVLTNGSLSRLSHVVSRLERRGWVRREPCPEDGRYTNAVLTDEGFAALVAAAPGHVENVRRLVVDVLTDEELEQLGTITRKILGQGTACPGGPADTAEGSRS